MSHPGASASTSASKASASRASPSSASSHSRKARAHRSVVSGVDRGFSPVLHFCTDPRFGRCEEAFSEDPALISALGVAAVTGLAGPGTAGASDEYLKDPTISIATEAKHYAACVEPFLRVPLVRRTLRSARVALH